MKFYRIKYGDWGGRYSDGQQVFEWATNKHEAKKIARANDDGDYKSVIEEIDVPTAKIRLLDFLNYYCITR